jgi:hypothetical protein
MAAPTLVGTASLDGQSVALRFAAAIDAATASDSARYAIPGATIQNVAMPDDKTVILSVTGLAGTGYTVSGTGIKDALGVEGNISGSGPILNFAVQEIGTLPGPSFGYAYSTSTIAMKVDGGVLWGAADSSKYIYQTRTGDFDVRVKVNKAAAGNGASNVALDARESLEPGSRHVAITVYPGMGNWTAFRRDVADGPSGVLDGNWRIGWPVGAMHPDIWLRIKYLNNTFTTYGSTNGLNWNQIGNAYTPVTPYAAKYIGMAAVATDAGIPPVEAEFSDFEEFALGNASIVINEQPQAVTTTENHSATFTTAAELINGPAGLLSYQWLSNGLPVPQASGTSYTVALPKLVNSGDEYRVIVNAPGVLSVTSAVAVLTVQADTVAPYALSSGGLPGESVAVRFNELMDPVTANDASRYSLGAAMMVESATLMDDQQTVVLGVSTLSGTGFALQVTGVNDLAGNALTTTVNGPVLNLTSQDIGPLLTPSFAYADSPTHVVSKVDGGGIWFGYDTASYLYQTRTNDFDVKVRIDKVQGSFNGNVALDVRESADQGSRHVAITVYPTMGNWTAFARDVAEGATSVLQGNWRIGWPAGAGYPNIWLRIKRTANTFSTYGSTNGLDWIQIGNSYTPSAPFAATALVGIAAATTDTGVSPQVFEFSNFDEFSITGASIQINGQPSSISVEEHHPATFTVQAALLNGPSSALVFQWQRNGEVIPEATKASYTMVDPTFANQGDQVRVRISAPGLDPVFSSAATLNITADTTAPAIEASGAIKNVSVGIRFNEMLDATTAADPGKYAVTGASVVSATVLSDGRSVVLTTPDLAGPSFAVQVTGVRDATGNSFSGTVNGLVQDFQVADVGALNTPSLVYSFSPDSVESVVDGGTIWGGADSGNFIGRMMSGDFDVRTQVRKTSGGSHNSNMLLDVRESLEPGSRHFALTVYPTQRRWVAFLRDTADGASGVAAGLWLIDWPQGVDFPNVWLRVRKLGNTFTAYGGTNGLDWVQVGSSYTPATPYASTFVAMASAVTDAGQLPLQTEFSSFGTVVIRPQIQIASSATGIVLTWPVESTGFHLEKSAQLGAAASWSTASEPVAVEGLNNVVNVAAGTGTWFYRLVR